MLPLEDLYNDVLAKAQRGLKLDDAAVAQSAGVPLESLIEAKAGNSTNHLQELASALGIHGPSLAVMAANGWRPRAVEMTGVAQFNTVFHDMTVNAYVIHDPITKQAAVFDTSASAEPILKHIKQEGLSLEYVFITHTHTDHIADLSTLVSVTPAPKCFTNAQEPADGCIQFQIAEKPEWKLGRLRITARSTTGHSRGGTTYFIEGLSQPVAIVGDALFASSMGGGMVSFPEALATNRKELFTMPDDTIVCPGHGPMTTIGEEKAHNPFYPEFK